MKTAYMLQQQTVVLPMYLLISRGQGREQSCGAQDEVDAALGADDIANLADLERIRRVLERFLHLALHPTPNSKSDTSTAARSRQRTGLKNPRSPPCECELQSLCLDASWANFSGELLICASYPFRIWIASSFERVMLGYMQRLHQHD